MIDVLDRRFQRLRTGARRAASRRLDPRQEREDVFIAERLGEEVERPELPGLDGQGDAAVGRHDDHFRIGHMVALDALEELDAVELGHLQVGHDDVVVPGEELLQGLDPVRRGDHLMALGLQVLGQRDPLDLLVVGDQDSHG